MAVAGKYGSIGSLITFVALVSLYYLGRHPLLIPIAFDLRIIVFALFIIVAIREFRNESNAGVLHFWQGLAIGIATYVLIAFIVSLALWIFAGMVDPGFVSDYIQLSVERLEGNRDVFLETIGEERLNKALEALPATSAGDLAFDYFLKSLPIGFILTLVITLFFRRQPN